MSTDIRVGDCRSVLASLDAESVQCCVTSPPYFGLRDYGVAGQIGLEPTPDAFVAELVAVFAEVRRVLKDDGTLWLNLGDSYAAQRGGTCMPAETLAGGVAGEGDEAAHRGRPGGPSDKEKTRHSQYMPARFASRIGLKHKDLIGVPWRVAFALQADGWYLRSDIIWSKPNPMPESVTDRPTKAHEYLFLLAKSERYYYDADAIREEGAGRLDLGRMTKATARIGEGGKWADDAGVKDDPTRNRRSVWTVATTPYSGAHFATFPPALIEPCILAGSRVGDTILDPFGGAGTTGLVADRLNRNALLIELNPTYATLARHRIVDDNPLFASA